jgi:hypothetical protein
MSAQDLAASISELEASLSTLALWMHIFTTLVVIGLLLEYKEIRDAIRQRTFTVPAIAVSLLILGVAGELFVGFQASRKETDLRIANDLRSAQFNNEAAQARKEAGLALERTATAEQATALTRGKLAVLEKEAADAKVSLEKQRERTANAELALLELKQKFAWRRLIGPQRDRFVSSLSKSEDKQLVTIQVSITDPEACRFASDITEGLAMAGWRVELAGSYGLSGARYGLIVGSRFFGPKRAGTLIHALHTSGIGAYPQSDESMGPNEVTLSVGMRPIPLSKSEAQALREETDRE